MMRAVRKHTDTKWILLYIERWLKVPVVMPDGSTVERTKGTPQGGVISPLLANIFLHHAFDEWMRKRFSDMPFERYADDSAPRGYTRDEGRPLGIGLQEQIPNRLKLHRIVASIKEKAQRMCQVRIKETNVSEPLMKCRKRIDNIKTRRSRYSGINSGETCLLPEWCSVCRWSELDSGFCVERGNLFCDDKGEIQVEDPQE